MNPAYYVFFFIALYVPIFILFSEKKKRNRILRRIRKKRRGSGHMNQELLSGFIGKTCMIKATETIQGEIERIEGNWMEIETKQGKELLNIDFIERIQEYPFHKKR